MTCTWLTLGFGGALMPSSSISNSRIMSASSSSLSSSSFRMFWIIALRLLTIPLFFHGAGRGVASSVSSILSSTLSLRRNAGVARPFSVEVGEPSSPTFLFLGVTNWLNKFLFATDSGVRSPRILDADDASLAASLSFVGVWNRLGSISPNIIRRLLGVPSVMLSKSPSTMPSRCGVGPMKAGP